MPFKKTVADNAGNLVINQVQSPNFSDANPNNVLGWQIKKDGTATFQSLRVRNRLVMSNSSIINPGGTWDMRGYPQIDTLCYGSKTTTVDTQFNTTVITNADLSFAPNDVSGANGPTWNFNDLFQFFAAYPNQFQSSIELDVTYNLDIEHTGAGTSTFFVTFFYDRPAWGIYSAESRVIIPSTFMTTRIANNTRTSLSCRALFDVPIITGETPVVQLGAQARCNVAGDNYRIYAGSSSLVSKISPAALPTSISLH